VEGKVWSVRPGGDIVYVNFGRRWTEGLRDYFRATVGALEAAGIAPNSLENPAHSCPVAGWKQRVDHE